MLSNRFFGIGFIVIGLSISCNGILELTSGQFSTVGYTGRSNWIKTYLTLCFGSFAPHVSGLLWLVLSSCFVWLGLKELLRKK